MNVDNADVNVDIFRLSIKHVVLLNNKMGDNFRQKKSVIHVSSLPHFTHTHTHTHLCAITQHTSTYQTHNDTPLLLLLLMLTTTDDIPLDRPIIYCEAVAPFTRTAGMVLCLLLLVLLLLLLLFGY